MPCISSFARDIEGPYGNCVKTHASLRESQRLKPPHKQNLNAALQALLRSKVTSLKLKHQKQDRLKNFVAQN